MSNKEAQKPTEIPADSAGRTAEPAQENDSVFQRIAALLKPLAISRFKIIDLADAEQTITGIKKDIEFRGFNLWILVFSVVICSIGLNVDSVPRTLMKL